MSQEQAMANVPQQERCNIARIDFSVREGCMKHISGLMTNAKFPISI